MEEVEEHKLETWRSKYYMPFHATCIGVFFKAHYGLAHTTFITKAHGTAGQKILKSLGPKKLVKSNETISRNLV